MFTHSIYRKWLPFFSIAIVYALGANIDIMEVDAAQYANIAREMLASERWLEVHDRNQDYLDKPPLLFWLSALSFKLFGLGNWQYKLPSILFSLLGLFSTYRLGNLLYGKQVANYSVVILGSSLAMIIMNNDVKTDTILVSSIVFSTWMLVSAIKTNSWKYYICSALGIAMAMLTKGPIGLMMPLLAIGGHALLKREWKVIFNPKWLASIVIILMALIPMCIGLLKQHGSEGIRFYFWTQSFGRITGESVWQNDSTPFYFFHEFAWSFLPWSILGGIALFRELSKLPKKLSDDGTELYLISGVALVWFGLSFSHFKLPHYIFVVYPFVAILTAKHITFFKRTTFVAWIQLFVSILGASMFVLLLYYCFPSSNKLYSVFMALLMTIAILLFLNTYRSAQVIWPSFVMSIGLGFGLNLVFYPQILQYQANSQVGKWVVENHVPHGQFIGFSTGGRSLDFYSNRTVPWKLDALSTISSIEPGVVVYAREDLRNVLIERGYPPRKEIPFDNYSVQNLKPEFLDPKKRDSILRTNYLMIY